MLAAAALIRPLAQELPFATSVALKRKIYIYTRLMKARMSISLVHCDVGWMNE